MKTANTGPLVNVLVEECDYARHEVRGQNRYESGSAPDLVVLPGGSSSRRVPVRRQQASSAQVAGPVHGADTPLPQPTVTRNSTAVRPASPVDCGYRQVPTDRADKNVRDLDVAGYASTAPVVGFIQRECARPSRFKK